VHAKCFKQAGEAAEAAVSFPAVIQRIPQNVFCNQKSNDSKAAVTLSPAAVMLSGVEARTAG